MLVDQHVCIIATTQRVSTLGKRAQTVLKLLTVIAVKPEVNVIVMISSMKHTPWQPQAYMPLESLGVYHRSID